MLQLSKVGHTAKRNFVQEEDAETPKSQFEQGDDVIISGFRNAFARKKLRQVRSGTVEPLKTTVDTFTAAPPARTSPVLADRYKL